MAELRVIALALVAGSGVVPPAGWIALPQLVKLDGGAAWGDPARGCYAEHLAVRGGRASADVMASQVVASIRSEHSVSSVAAIAVTDLVQPAAGAERGTLAFAFERAPYHGRVRAQLSNDGAITALACFWNQREPVACAAACTLLLGSMP